MKFTRQWQILILCGSLSSCIWGSHTIKTQITTDSSLNPNERGNPGPVALKIYQLSSRRNFDKIDFLSEFKKTDLTLASELVEEQVCILKPGQEKEIVLKVKDRTKYIAFLAGFRRTDGPWKKVIDLQEFKSLKLAIFLDERSLRQ